MNRIVREDIESIIDSSCVDWNTFKGKTVLITGANGMLPSYMALTFLRLNQRFDLNIKLICLVRNKAKADIVFSDFIGDKNLDFIVQDVSSPISYEGELHYIIHAASQASPKYYGIDPVGTAKANLLGTINLLELARTKSLESFLFFSSGGIYGDFNEDDSVMVEDSYGIIDPIKVRSCYFEGKRMAENLCVDYNYQYGIPTKIVRVFHTLGPNVNLTDGRAFSDFCNSIINNRDIVLKSDGSVERSFCYITDAVKGYFKVLTNGRCAYPYNVGNPYNLISIKSLAYLLVELYSYKKLHVRVSIDCNDITYFAMKTNVKRNIPSISRLEKLGWVPTVPIADTFKRVIDSKSVNL